MAQIEGNPVMRLHLLPYVAYLAGWMCVAAITIQAYLDRPHYTGRHRGVGRSTRRRDRRMAGGTAASREGAEARAVLVASYNHWAGSPAYANLKTRVLHQQARVDVKALRLRTSSMPAVRTSVYGTPEMADVWGDLDEVAA